MTVTRCVAPYAGAWIEISIYQLWYNVGLVAPYAGAWIEIYYVSCYVASCSCRSLRGSVD